MRTKHRRLPVAVMLLAGLGVQAHAQAQQTDEPPQAEAKDPTKEFVKKINEATGLEFWGYGRGGFYSAGKGRLEGGYSLGGDLQKYRLGNEGDNYLEFGIGKKFDLGNGIHWGVFYMPTIYNGKSGTAQAYFSLGGIFGNTATLWAGQRYRRIQDVHIVDKWVVEDGDNFGAGIDDIPLGGLGRLNVALHTADSVDNKNGNPNNAKRINLQWRDIPTNPDGKLTVTGGLVSGDFAKGRDGGALGLMHIQKNFLVPGLNNTVILQASSGHASLSGKFYNLDSSSTTTGLLLPPGFGVDNMLLFAPLVERTVVTPQAGARQRRILDSVDFQIGRFGGQGLIGYQTTRADNGPEVKDFSLGGRVSYGIARYTKLLAEVATTRRSTDNQPRQTLNKGTIAVAFSPDTNFWTRPEFRIYATRAGWNKAAGDANAASFGANGRRSATTFGVQMEAWWE
ncbi:carbohydrate porin [Variovorax boronicumulans]|uniref:carbohydrate porin n=1 Tax=Variovorax boronicumulans TaxID=436515 RepID=UPI0033963248